MIRYKTALLLNEAKLMFSTLDDPEHWLWQEKEARTSAASTAHMKAREILLRLADDYRRRAEIAEERRRTDAQGRTENPRDAA